MNRYDRELRHKKRMQPVDALFGWFERFAARLSGGQWSNSQSYSIANVFLLWWLLFYLVFGIPLLLYWLLVVLPLHYRLPRVTPLFMYPLYASLIILGPNLLSGSVSFSSAPQPANWSEFNQAKVEAFIGAELPDNLDEMYFTSNSGWVWVYFRSSEEDSRTFLNELGFTDELKEGYNPLRGQPSHNPRWTPPTDSRVQNQKGQTFTVADKIFEVSMVGSPDSTEVSLYLRVHEKEH